MENNNNKTQVEVNEKKKEQMKLCHHWFIATNGNYNVN